MKRSVLVLNAGYEPLVRVSLQHAIRMLVREVAVVEEPAAGRFFGPYPVPEVLRLTRPVGMEWAGRSQGWTREGIKNRDGHCAYCLGPAETVDHVLPKSRGGPNSWLNLVAACFLCNQAKADRTPEEAGMKLRVTPYVPRPVIAMHLLA